MILSSTMPKPRSVIIAAMRVLGCFALMMSAGLRAQTSAPPAAFEDYPVKQIYRGVPMPPKLSKNQRTYRTVIRFGAKSTVEFAGHYTFPRYGCGSGCSAFYIEDSVNGRVYDGFNVQDLPGTWLEKQNGDPSKRLEYRQDSRLLRINGCPNEMNCGYYDYVMVDGKGLKLVRKQLLPKEFQY
jgi:hypothetical protein